MKTLLSLTRKEFFEATRNYKLFIIPIVFMLLAAMQPLTFYYMPDLMKMAVFTEGTIIQIPLPSAEEAVNSIYLQLAQLGLIILILVSMGTISNELKSGVAETILTKPISRTHYLASKWIFYFTLTIISSILGVIAGNYYTAYLIGTVDWLPIIISGLYFLIFMLLFVAFTLFLSTIFRSGIVAGVIAIVANFVFTILASFSLKFWFLPSYLLTISQNLLLDRKVEYLGISVAFNLFLIVVFFAASSYQLYRKDI